MTDEIKKAYDSYRETLFSHEVDSFRYAMGATSINDLTFSAFLAGYDYACKVARDWCSEPCSGHDDMLRDQGHKFVSRRENTFADSGMLLDHLILVRRGKLRGGRRLGIDELLAKPPQVAPE